MVLILTSLNDAMANAVMEYLWHEHTIRAKRHFLLNSEEIHVGINNEEGAYFKSTDDFKAIWINKGFHFHSDIYEEVDDKISLFLKEEVKEYRKNILLAISNLTLPVIGRNPVEYIDVSKFRALIEAVGVGLNIPSTCYTHSLAAAKNFIDSHEKIVVKPATNIAFFDSKDSMYQYSMYTKILKNSDFNEEDFDFNFPSLIQEYIDAKFEIRVFCIDNLFWSGAILSKSLYEDSSICDCRVNLSQRRIMPFHLHESIREKLCRLMAVLGLNCASIDLIFDDKDNYYFLEINPVGQFEFLSSACNYNIEAVIANWLAKNINHEEIH